MVTRALHDCGLHLIAERDEELLDAAEDNPEGFWENKAIVECNDDLLEATGGAWDNPPDLPPLAVDDNRVASLVDSATAAIAALSEHERWGFKDPRTCLTAAYWLDLCPDLHFVICVRHPIEVALSLKRRNQNSYSLGLRLWERYYETVLDLVPPERRIVTHYDTFFIDPEGEIGRICDFAALTPVPPSVRTDLRHHTSAVSLVDAGVNENVRKLYASLCREAGAPSPRESAPDEGRVRRLILDGAVASRHAEQRQDAIDRLQEREAQFRSEHAETERAHAATENDMRERIRDLERQVAAARTETLQRTLTLERQVTAARTEALHRTLDKRLTRIDSRLREIEPGPIGKVARRATRRAERGLVRWALKPGRHAVREAANVAAREARRRVKALPEPAQRNVRRSRRLVARARQDPIATAGVVRRKSVPKARAAAKRYVPAPAQKPLRQADRMYRRTRKAAVPAAKGAAKRLPPSAQQPLRRAWRRIGRTRPTPAPAPKPQSQRPTIPKGLPYREWKAEYEQMLATHVQGASWLMVAPGSPKDARRAHTPNATLFPSERNGQPLGDDLAHIAHLEALRFQGQRYLVLPEGSRPWFERQVEFRDHVATHYRTVVDTPGAGVVFDISQRQEARAMSLLGAVTELAANFSGAPAVLNWTARDIEHELPGITTFRAPTESELPYLDHTIDVVVVENTHDADEARRVATTGIIVVSEDGARLDAQPLRANGNGASDGAHVVVWSPDLGNEEWNRRLAESAAAAGAEWRKAPIDAGLREVDDDDVILVVEPFVLPLPGTIERAVRVVAGKADGAHAGKVLRADGRLEAAGGTVFSDRSSALIGNASDGVRAPWHEYVRPVCWGPGIVAASGALWRTVRSENGLSGRPFIREWCAAVWEMGRDVVYEPSLVAVRVHGDAEEPRTPLEHSSWQRVLDLRPQRPAELTDGAWRYLLAHDDVQLRGA